MFRWDSSANSATASARTDSKAIPLPGSKRSIASFGPGSVDSEGQRCINPSLYRVDHLLISHGHRRAAPSLTRAPRRRRDQQRERVRLPISVTPVSIGLDLDSARMAAPAQRHHPARDAPQYPRRAPPPLMGRRAAAFRAGQAQQDGKGTSRVSLMP